MPIVRRFSHNETDDIVEFDRILQSKDLEVLFRLEGLEWISGRLNNLLDAHTLPVFQLFNTSSELDVFFSLSQVLKCCCFQWTFLLVLMQANVLESLQNIETEVLLPNE